MSSSILETEPDLNEFIWNALHIGSGLISIQ